MFQLLDEEPKIKSRTDNDAFLPTMNIVLDEPKEAVDNDTSSTRTDSLDLPKHKEMNRQTKSTFDSIPRFTRVVDSRSKDFKSRADDRLDSDGDEDDDVNWRKLRSSMKSRTNLS